MGITGNTSNGVQVISSALPTGASTEATLALIKAKTDNIPGRIVEIDGASFAVSGVIHFVIQPLINQMQMLLTLLYFAIIMPLIRERLKQRTVRIGW